MKKISSLFFLIFFGLNFILQNEIKASPLFQTECEVSQNLESDLPEIYLTDCHNSSDENNHDSDCHCSNHRSFCCNSLTLFKLGNDLSIFLLTSSVTYGLQNNSIKSEPLLDGPYQPPRA